MSNQNNNRAFAGVTVAALALTLAWSAAAAAGPTPESARAASGLTKAEKREVKKIAKKMAARQVRRLAPGLSVASAKTAGSAQTAVSAQSAAHALTADMATNAQTAVNAGTVGGINVRKINAVIAPDGAPVVVISDEGFTLTASCTAGAADLVAASTAGGRLRSADIDNNEVVSTEGSNNVSATGLSIRAGGDGRGSLTMEFVSTSGKVINAWVGYRNDAPGCAYFGNYMVG